MTSLMVPAPTPLRRIFAPFTRSLVVRLNEWQGNPRVDPFTCGGDRSTERHLMFQRLLRQADAGVLFATVEGWVCRACDYKQAWAYAVMAGEPNVLPNEDEEGT